MPAAYSCIVAPQITERASKSITLQPITLALELALDVSPSQHTLPLRITISLLDEGRTDKPLESRGNGSSSEGDTSVIDTEPFVQLSDDHADCDVTIPFLPLPVDFDPADSSHWAALADDIQAWLLSTVPPTSSQWTWGRDAFWLAFTAAYPAFPRVMLDWLEYTFETAGTKLSTQGQCPATTILKLRLDQDTGKLAVISLLTIGLTTVFMYYFVLGDQEDGGSSRLERVRNNCSHGVLSHRLEVASQAAMMPPETIIAL
ncbi:hypothetical protein CONPUDRAFT_78417 [Coniophora puteana RWD-64-598 SS2]|uniref:Uncharacterized protein n=1 Tax=Coniophora puteana (strain RWD-64-598) TaxID=741705 RepID=R7SDH3_CONPW|nr:uncharacterized protein CONPUDRAFT_78417 [Coniophora puteana RWD-64-598 SS2]EIW73930.1 hypothetical protein CONPUDRAFT_78417 [Coniophora puteana RWD-64-598 SS2]